MINKIIAKPKPAADIPTAHDIHFWAAAIFGSVNELDLLINAKILPDTINKPRKMIIINISVNFELIPAI